MLRDSNDPKDVLLFALANQVFFRKELSLELLHGIQDATTISRILRVLDPDEPVSVFMDFLILLNLSLGDVLSFDGITIRAVTGEEAVRYILSFLSHETHLALCQIGVDGKERMRSQSLSAYSIR